MTEHVVIIGGGLAGLAAATALAGRPGLRITLLESRARWGGRASSFVDQTTGEPINNCQHVSLGCCTNFQHFCRTTGIDQFFHREKELVFVAPDGTFSPMAASPLPAPLHLALSFARFGYLSWRDKRALARGLCALAHVKPVDCQGQSFLDWLKAHGQTADAIDRFWHVVLVSALSETLDRIDVGHARKVFVDAFLANRQGWKVWLPTVPLDELYGERIAAWFAERNVATRLQAGVKRVVVETAADSAQPRAGGVELRSGEIVDADHVILAVPQNLVLGLLPDHYQSDPQLAGISQLETVPISSVHLWFDRPITELRHATFVGRMSQWLFNRSAIQKEMRTSEFGIRNEQPAAASPQANVQIGNSSSAPGAALVKRDDVNSEFRIPNSELFYYQVVISASRDVLALGQEGAIAAVVAELADVWPAVESARLVHSRLVTEHKAVVSMLPGVDRLRPVQQSPIVNLQLAGDWTQTGWPGTMEGAVRSGYLAAENVLEHCRLVGKLVQPDLPVALLSKLLFGL